MHCTHSCGSLVKQFPISNEPDLTIYPRKHCRKQDAAAGGPGGCDDIASYFFSRNRVYIHLYLTPCPISSGRGRSWMLATGLEGLKFVPQKWGTFMFVPQVPQMGYKWGTQKGPHTFFRRFGYYALYAL